MKKLLCVLIGLALVTTMCVLVTACDEEETTTTTEASTDISTDTTAAEASKGTIKIGHIRPISGVMAMTSERMTKAFDWAFEQVDYRVAGYDIEIVIGDSKGDPATAVDVAREMVESDGVAMLVGPTQGGEQMAVAGYASQVGIPVLFTNPAPFPCATPEFPWVVSAYGTEPQISSAMGVYCYDELGYKTVDILSSDFAPGRGFSAAFKAGFEGKGGTVNQEIYAPYPTSDFSSYLTTLKDADAVAAWTDGEQAIKLLTQYDELSVGERMPIVGIFHGSFLAPFILSALDPAVAEAYVGTIVPTPYSPLLDTPENETFVADFRAKFGSYPEDTDSGPYNGASIIINALEATGGDTTPETLLDALVAVDFPGPEGQIKFDPATRSAIKSVYIAEVIKEGDEFIWNPIYTYEDVPATGL